MLDYAVVEFLETKDVDIVHKSWLNSKDHGMFCYWPKLGHSKKARTGAIPDPANWSEYSIRIMSFTDEYTTAQRRCKAAEFTSNIESEDEEQLPTKRTRRPPTKLDNDDTDSEDESSRPTSRRRSNNASPNPGIILIETAHKETGQSFPDIPLPTLDLNRNDTPFQANNLSERQSPFAKEPTCIDELPQIFSRVNRKEREEKIIVLKLNQIIENQKEQLSLLRQIVNQVPRRELDNVEEVNVSELKTMTTTEEINEFCKKLTEDEEFAKKMVKLLSSLGGHSPGDAMRRMFHHLGCNALWGQYSMHGKKGKIALSNLSICKLLIKAQNRNFPGTKAVEIEDLIRETLKHAPARQGGSRYKEPKTKKLPAAAAGLNIEEAGDERQ